MPTPIINLSTPVTLESVKAQFVHWRTTRTKMGKIPDHLWDAVMLLTKEYQHYKITSELGLNVSQFQNKIRSYRDQEASTHSGKSNFIEVASLPFTKPSLPFREEETPILELTRPDGATLKAMGLGHKELISMVERFLA